MSGLTTQKVIARNNGEREKNAKAKHSPAGHGRTDSTRGKNRNERLRWQ